MTSLSCRQIFLSGKNGMAPEIRERICAQLSEVLVVLDQERCSVAAICVAHALDALCYAQSDPLDPGPTTVLQ
jgi:hypothetical protein